MKRLLFCGVLLGLLAWASPPPVQANCVVTAGETFAVGTYLPDDKCDGSGSKKVTAGSGTTPSGAGAATAAAPTLAEASTGYFSWDLAGNLRVTLGTCLSGESACLGTSPSSFIMVAPAIPRPTIAITGVTTNTTSATFTLPSGAKTLTGKVEGTGAVTQTQTLYCAYDSTAANGVSLSVVTLSGTTKDVKNGSVQVTTDCPFYYVVTTNTTGTGATGELTVENGLVAAGTGGGGAVTNAGTFAVQSTSEPATGVEDAAETAGGALKMMGSVRRDVAATSTGATAENATVNTDALGLVWSRTLDPCSGVAKTYLPISISTATTTEITPSLAGASTNYYVCSLNLVTAAANNVALVDDDSDGCGSVTSGMAGGTTAASGWNLAANSGIVHGDGSSSVFRTVGTNRVICLVTSVATQLSGAITVVAAP